MKIYDVGTYQVVHTLDYPGAILSVGVSVSTVKFLNFQTQENFGVIILKLEKEVLP